MLELVMEADVVHLLEHVVPVTGEHTRPSTAPAQESFGCLAHDPVMPQVGPIGESSYGGVSQCLRSADCLLDGGDHLVGYCCGAPKDDAGGLG